MRGAIRRLCTQIEPLSARDGVIALNVSGKSFSLLRSTASLSPTLQRHLAAADDNTALLKDGAVFIDRDPELFGVVLTHLRNKAGNVTRHAVHRQDATVELDSLDLLAIRGVWTEAMFFELPALSDEVSHYHKSVGILRRAQAAGGTQSMASALRSAAAIAGALGLTWHVAGQEVEGDKSSSERVLEKLAKAAKIFLG